MSDFLKKKEKRKQGREGKRIAIRHLRNGINLVVSVTHSKALSKCICIWNQRSNGNIIPTAPPPPSLPGQASTGMDGKKREKSPSKENLIRLHNASWTYRWSAWLEWRCWMPLCMHVGGIELDGGWMDLFFFLPSTPHILSCPSLLILIHLGAIYPRVKHSRPALQFEFFPTS